DPAEPEEHERQDQVHDPDLLVVGGGDPVHPLLRLARHRHLVRADLGNRARGVVGGGHRVGDSYWPRLLVAVRIARNRVTSSFACAIAAFWWAIHALYCCGVTTWTKANIAAWFTPHSWAH